MPIFSVWATFDSVYSSFAANPGVLGTVRAAETAAGEDDTLSLNETSAFTFFGGASTALGPYDMRQITLSTGGTAIWMGGADSSGGLLVPLDIAAYDTFNEGTAFTVTGSVVITSALYSSFVSSGTAPNERPVVDLDGPAGDQNFEADFTEDGGPVTIADSDATLTDSDGTTLTSMSVTITNFRTGDILAATASGEITTDHITYDGGVLTIDPGAAVSIADFQTVLRSVTFEAASQSPDTTTRSIRVQVDDGEDTSTNVTSLITVTSVNDAPTISAPTSISATEDQTGALAGFSLADVDAGSGTMSLSLSVSGGTISALSGAGVSVLSLGSSNLFLQGSVADLNAFIADDRVSWTPSANADSDQILALQVSDAGNTGTGGSLVAQTTVTLDLTAVDDGGIAIDDAFTTVEGTGLSGSVFAANPTMSDSDIDSELMVGMVNGLAGNVGTQIALASGALLTLNSDGTFAYDQNGAFAALPGTASGAFGQATDSFTYSLSDGATATVTVTIGGIDSDGDVLEGTSGGDVLLAGLGNDTVTGFGGNDDLDGGTGDDLVLGGAGDDTLLGGEGRDSLSGGVGNDRIDGGMGDDAMRGDGGDDTYAVDSLADSVIELIGGGTDTVEANLSWRLDLDGREALENLTLAGVADIDGYGNGGDNVIVGNAGANLLYGFGGDDTLVGADGDDSAIGGDGNDLIFGDDGNDLLIGDEGGDVLQGGIGNDDLNGNAGDDILRGQEGNDTLRGHDGVDDLSGGIGDDLLLAGSGADTLIGQSGADTLVGQSGADVLYGGDEVDDLFGGSGNDILVGGDGDDILNGGNGDDWLRGGIGADTYVFDALVLGEITNDRIGTWDGSDVIDVSGLDADSVTLSDDAFTFVGTGPLAGAGGTLRFEQIDGSTFVEADATGDGIADFNIQIVGLFNLTADDFIL